MQTTDKLFPVAEAVASGRYAFLPNEDRAWALIRAKIVPAVRVGRRVYLSEQQLAAFIASGGSAK